MIIDWTITIGNIFTVLGFAGSGVIFVMMMRSDIRLLGQRVTAVETALLTVSQTTVTMARQEGRLETLDERLNLVSRRLDEHISNTVYSVERTNGLR